MRRWNLIDWIAFILVIIGGLNWGLIGIFDFDVVAAIFGMKTMAAKVVYTLVGISALYELVVAFVREPETAEARS